MLSILELKAGYRRERLIIRDLNLQVDRRSKLWIKCPHFSVGRLLMALITGQIRPVEGEIRIMGRKPYMLSSASVPYFMRNLGLFWPDIPLLTEGTVRENLFWRLAALGEKRHRSLIESALSLFGLTSIADVEVSKLSRSERARVALARATVSVPPLIIALEPARDLPEREADRILRILSHLTALGSTVIVIASDYPPESLGFKLVEIEER